MDGWENGRTERGIDPIIGTQVVEANVIHPLRHNKSHIPRKPFKNVRFVSGSSDLFIDTGTSTIHSPILRAHYKFQRTFSLKIP